MPPPSSQPVPGGSPSSARYIDTTVVEAVEIALPAGNPRPDWAGGRSQQGYGISGGREAAAAIRPAKPAATFPD